MRAPLACPERFIPQVAVTTFAFAGDTAFLSVLNSNIYTAPKAGGTATLMVTLPFLPGQMVPSGALLYDVTVATPGNSGIYAIPQSGGAPAALVSGIDGTPFAIDGRFAYYSQRLQNRIYRVALDAVDGAPPSEFVTQAPLSSVFAVDAGFLYWTEFAGQYAFRRMLLPDGTPEIVFVESDLGVRPLFFGDDVYWFRPLAGQVMRVPKTGGPAELFYEGQGSTITRGGRIVIAAGFAYVYDATRTLYRVSLATRMRETLVEDVKVEDLQVDDDAVYFAEMQTGVYRLRHRSP